MIRKIAWETFKNTGNINSFMEFKQIENIEKEIENEKGNVELNQSLTKGNIVPVQNSTGPVQDTTKSN